MNEPDLESFLRRQIAASGAMPVGEYMSRCVSRYYAGRDPFGRAGDFITAPEISQMFGEVIGLWAAIVWQLMGEPETILLTELGPGRGTLMADMLRAAAMLPGFRKAIRVHLVENSPALRDRQKQSLGDEPVVWLDEIGQLPDGPAIVIANEFFDALPIDQYVFRADGWHERQVSCREDQFSFVDGPPAPDRRLQDWGAPEAHLGDIFEVNSTARAIVQALGQRFAHQKGALLAIDYGHDRTGLGDTLQAVRQHQPVPALESPGEVDLTAHVDFAALVREAAPAKASPIVGQGGFLRRLGIELRAERLAAARPDRAEDTIAACHRLINPQGMGTLFKVLALSSPDMPDLPGFLP